MSPLRKMRLSQDTPLREIAQRLGISEATYSRKERGELPISPEEAERLVGELGPPLTEMHVLFPDRYPDFDPLAHVEA